MVRLFTELRRRSVFRAAAAYIVISWLVLQVVDVLADILRLPSWPGQLILLTLAVGFPIVLVISWLYELTPDGLRRDTSASGETVSSDPAIARKIDYVIIAILAAAVALLVASNYLLPRLVTDDEGLSSISVAVLPFVNMSSDPETEYFSDGLSEELLNVLAQVRDFRVPGRTSSFAFKNRNEDLREIGALLDVKHILEGSVRQQGDKIRITAQLNDVDTGFHRWSKTYDRELNDIFEVQDDIATEVAKALKDILLDEDREVIAKKATENADAYQSFLQGEHFLELRTPEGTEKALAAFVRATELDSEYAAAWAGLALAYGYLPSYGLMGEDESNQLGRAALDRALDIDPDHYWVQYAKGVWAETREEKIRAYERAIELNPNDPTAYISLGWVHDTFVDGADRRLELMRKAYELDPLSRRTVEQYSIQVSNVGKWEESLQLLYDHRAFDPEWLGTYETVARMLEHQGRMGESALEVSAIQQKFPDLAWASAWLAKHHMVWGDYDRAREYLDLAKETQGFDVWIEMYEASLAARQGNLKDAYAIVLDYMESNEKPLYHMLLAELSLLAGDSKLAANHADEFFASRPDNDFLDFHLTAAIAYRDVGRVEEAVTRARWVIERADLAESKGLVHWWWPESRGSANALLGNSEAALKDLKAAIDLGYMDMSLPFSYNAFPHVDLLYVDLLDNPDFQALKAVIDQRIDAARESYEAKSTSRDSVAL